MYISNKSLANICSTRNCDFSRESGEIQPLAAPEWQPSHPPANVSSMSSPPPAPQHIATVILTSGRRAQAVVVGWRPEPPRASRQLATFAMRKKGRPARRPDQGDASLVRAVSHGSVVHPWWAAVTGGRRASPHKSGAWRGCRLARAMPVAQEHSAAPRCRRSSTYQALAAAYLDEDRSWRAPRVCATPRHSRVPRDTTMVK